ncbi:hypothetical protein [Candidatus Contubernalis alkaliaceticus]|uniref:hypothetical protein n=1 Tax=Candidatus Contubernalis alkaliaceticus TaxID=338645 RepID=UPI001F4C0AC7|nr:hypothetical protein [Candidatus Contubernalis alkalaceticus]UNC92542.1 hypothetical protein HUE98_10795 [Candidatus Contubernalis alkalaceticus]
MRTKWQSSPIGGDTVEVILKGNRQYGNDLVITGENLLDLSRNVYSLDYCLRITLYKLKSIFFV